MQVSQRILIRADLIEDGGIDPPDLLLREPSAGVQHRITVQLDGAFTVDEVLLRCLAREKIKLPLRFVGTRRRRLVPPFDAEFEPRDTVLRTDCLDLPTSHRNFEPV